MRWRWSDEARLLVHPFRVYAELAAAPPVGGIAALRAPASLMLAVACFISWTSAGKLVLDHLMFAVPSWAFVPVLQIVVVVAAARAAGSRRSAASIVDLYFRGHFPWMLLTALCSALCLIPSGTWPAYRTLLGSGALPAACLVAIGWCALLSYAFFRAGLGLSRLRATLTCAAFYAGVIGLGCGYYLVTNQLQPLLGIVP